MLGLVCSGLVCSCSTNIPLTQHLFDVFRAKNPEEDAGCLGSRSAYPVPCTITLFEPSVDVRGGEFVGFGCGYEVSINQLEIRRLPHSDMVPALQDD